MRAGSVTGAAIAATVLTMVVTATSAGAQATVVDQAARDTPGCVTKREYKRIKTAGFEGESFGHRKDTVRKIFDTPGKRLKVRHETWRNQSRRYRPCDRRRGTYVLNYYKKQRGAAFRAYYKSRGCIEPGSEYPVSC